MSDINIYQQPAEASRRGNSSGRAGHAPRRCNSKLNKARKIAKGSEAVKRMLAYHGIGINSPDEVEA